RTMNINRLDPFSDVSAVRDRINRLLEEAQAPPVEGRAPGSRGWRPPVDIYEDADEVQVYVDLPGLREESIDIQLTGENLTVHGERRQEKREGGHFVHVERAEGAFQRSFTLGVPVNADNVRASYRDGVLVITLPKAETVKPRKVQIEVEGSAGEQAAGSAREIQGGVSGKIMAEGAGNSEQVKGK